MKFIFRIVVAIIVSGCTCNNPQKQNYSGKYHVGDKVCYTGKNCTVTEVSDFFDFYSISYIDNLGRINKVTVLFRNESLLTKGKCKE